MGSLSIGRSFLYQESSAIKVKTKTTASLVESSESVQAMTYCILLDDEYDVDQ